MSEPPPGGAEPQPQPDRLGWLLLLLAAQLVAYWACAFLLPTVNELVAYQRY